MKKCECCLRSVIVALGCLFLLVDGLSADMLDSNCVLQMAETAAEQTTLAELREACRVDSETTVKEENVESDTGAVEKRLDADRDSLLRPFTVMAHHPNYILPIAANTREWNSGDSDFPAKDEEAQFQFSLKVPLAIDLFGKRMDLYAAYTNRSFWQVYDSENSRPFRETNHEPELWAQFRNDWKVFGVTNTVNSFGLVHQSNGREQVFSRSWNRAYASFVFERDNWAFQVKPWLWLRGDREDSDNPDITEYMGHGEWRLAYGRNGHVFSMMSRNNLESGFDRGAIELSWSFPMFDYPYLKGYLQLFSGYGESLIDYDNKVTRIGMGISITDWLD